MSKRIIAGAGVIAGLAVAIAPVASFATVADGTTIGTQEDTLEVTINAKCDFGYDTTGTENDVTAVAHTAGTSDVGAWDGTDYTAAVYTDGDLTTAGAGSDTVAGTMEAGTTTNNFGATALTVVCNNTTGYHITAVGTNLKRTNDDATPIVAAAGASSVDGLWSASNTSKWSYKPVLSSSSSRSLAERKKRNRPVLWLASGLALRKAIPNRYCFFLDF